MEFISAVIAASGLKEFASIQITGNRKNTESSSKTTARIQLNVFCFFVNMFFLLLSFRQYILYDRQDNNKYCKYNCHC